MNIENIMSSFYKLPDVKNFILNFYKVEKGIRCNAKYKWEYEDKFYPIGYPSQFYRMCDINKNNYEYIGKYRTHHFFSYIFDESIKDVTVSSKVDEKIIGFTPVIDIDSPTIDSGGKRYDMFGDNRKSILNDINTTISVIKSELNELDLWNSSRLMSSGNGIYVILPDFYGTRKKVNAYTNKFVELLGDINTICENEYDIKGLIDYTDTLPWNDFFKIPFTLHYKYDRISIPLNKDKKITYRYLNKYSDPSKLSNDDIIRMIRNLE